MLLGCYNLKTLTLPSLTMDLVYFFEGLNEYLTVDYDSGDVIATSMQDYKVSNYVFSLPTNSSTYKLSKNLYAFYGRKYLYSGNYLNILTYKNSTYCGVSYRTPRYVQASFYLIPTITELNILKNTGTGKIANEFLSSTKITIAGERYYGVSTAGGDIKSKFSNKKPSFYIGRLFCSTEYF